MIKLNPPDDMTFIDTLNAALDIAEHVKRPVIFEFCGVGVSVKPLFDNVMLPRVVTAFEYQPDGTVDRKET